MPNLPDNILNILGSEKVDWFTRFSSVLLGFSSSGWHPRVQCAVSLQPGGWRCLRAPGGHVLLERATLPHFVHHVPGTLYPGLAELVG
ncbi:unnamed protein product, partial [Heterosigma akashiwo]